MAIKAELHNEYVMVNNWVLSRGEYYQLTAFDIYNMDEDSAHGFEPVVLSEDILLKCPQFDKIGDKFEIQLCKSKIFLRKCYLGGYYWGIDSSDCSFCELDDVEPFDYLHQLQNFIYIITGTHLTFKP